MNNQSLSRYRNIKSIIHSIDPITKVVAFLFIILSTFFAQSIGPLMVVTIFVFVVAILAKVRIRTYFKLLIIIVPFFLSMTAIYMLFAIGTSVDVIKVMEMTGQMSIRFYTLILLSVILTTTTREMEIAAGIEFLISPLRVIKVPTYEISTMIMLAIRFIPLLLSDLQMIMVAQTSRGVNVVNGTFTTKVKGVSNSLLPMLVIAFKRADDMSVAMTIRGYGVGQPRTKYRKTTYGLLEILTTLVIITFFIVILYLQFSGWGVWF